MQTTHIIETRKPDLVISKKNRYLILPIQNTSKGTGKRVVSRYQNTKLRTLDKLMKKMTRPISEIFKSLKKV